MKIYKKILYGFVTFLGLLLCMVVSLVVYEKYYLIRYEKTNIKISQTELEEKWDEPDNVLRYPNGRKTVFYFTILNEFAFNIDEGSNVDFKYKENF